MTPIAGVALPISRVPSNVQVFDTRDVRGVDAPDAATFLASRAASVQLSEAQGGTFQPDLSFRGFVASPLLGASEGLAVYLDGVRLNDPFGDTLAWDVLPDLAIAGIELLPGSNPLFGLNALGGSVALRTKDGATFGQERVRFTTGSFGRHRLEAESGGTRRNLSYYVAGSLTHDDGWRDFSPSTLRRFFGDVSWKGTSSFVDVSVAVASNALTGNGTAPIALLAVDRQAVFTHPDETDNDVALFSARFGRRLGADALFETVAYFRRSHLDTFNGDAADDDDDDHDEGEAEEEEDEDDEAGELFDGVNNRTRTRGHGAGVTAQWTSTRAFLGRGNHLAIAAGIDGAATRFGSSAELATLTESRGTIGSGLFDDDAAVGLRSRVVTTGVLLSETWSVTPRLTATGAARVNWTTLRLRDQLGDDLNGDHSFARLNPFAGVTFAARRGLDLFTSYGQSSRVPTPVELTCADPEDPCRLPNAFVSDPPLEQIVARTWEGGTRGRLGGWRWSSSVFRTDATDDIIFVSSGAGRGRGHFTNVERTRRAGIENSVSVDLPGGVSAFGAFTYQRATFDTTVRIASVIHPEAVDGEIEVTPGNRIPALPEYIWKTGASWMVQRLAVGGQLFAQSGIYLRGDEANLLPQVDGFARLDLHARYAFDRRLSVVAQMRNALNTTYSTFGGLGEASLIGDDAEPRFLSPGEPRGFWAGVEVGF